MFVFNTLTLGATLKIQLPASEALTGYRESRFFSLLSTTPELGYIMLWKVSRWVQVIHVNKPSR